MAINRLGGSNKTEGHVLNASTNYKTFNLQSPTALHKSDASWKFAVRSNGDVFAVLTQNSGSGKTEIHTFASVQVQQPGTIPSARDQINDYFRSLPTWVSKNPIDESQSHGDPEPDSDQVLPDETAESKKRRYSCSSTPYTIEKSPIKIVTFSPDAGKLWLGTLLQGNGYVNGLGSLKELPISQRVPLVIWIDLFGTNVSRRIPDPSGATVQEAIGALITEAKSRNTPWGSSISYQNRENLSTDEFTLKAGLSVKYMAADVKTKLDINQKADEKTVRAYFIQKAFTVSMVTPPTPADFFSTDFTKAALDEQVQLARIGPENLPVYVSSITFGRILMVSITARASTSDISAALDATYKGAAIEANANLDGRSKRILNEATINVASIGGNDAAIVGLSKSGDLYKYFDIDSDLAVMKPLSNQVDNMGDGSAARFTETINYNLTECLPLTNKKEKAGEVIRVKVTRGFVQNSRSGGSNNTCWEGFHRGAEVYGELSVNNTKVWDMHRDQHKSDIQPGAYFDIEYIQNVQSTLPSDDDLYPKNTLQENELAFLNGQGGSVRIVGKILDFNNVGGNPLNVYDQAETYPFEYGTKQIPAGSIHCPIDLEYEIVKLYDLYRYAP